MEEIIGVLNDVWSDALIVLGQGFIFHKNTFCRYVILRKCLVCCLTVKVQNLSFFFQALSMSLAGRVGGEYCRCSYILL
jgi:hypothetical protein